MNYKKSLLCSQSKTTRKRKVIFNDIWSHPPHWSCARARHSVQDAVHCGQQNSSSACSTQVTLDHWSGLECALCTWALSTSDSWSLEWAWVRTVHLSALDHWSGIEGRRGAVSAVFLLHYCFSLDFLQDFISSKISAFQCSIIPLFSISATSHPSDALVSNPWNPSESPGEK